MLAIEKCCYCAPRRAGLLAFGYVKVILIIVALWLTISGTSLSYPEGQEWSPIIFTVYYVTESVFYVILIVAATKSHLVFYKVFFYYSIMIFILLCAAVIVICTAWEHSTAVIDFSFSIRKEITFEVIIAIGVLFLLLQSYIILVTRSEMLKIRNTQSWNPRTGRNVLI